MNKKLTRSKVEALAVEMKEELSGEELLTKREAVALLKPSIDLKREAGRSLPEICEWLSNKGLTISPALLSQYLAALTQPKAASVSPKKVADANLRSNLSSADKAPGFVTPYKVSEL